MSIYAPTCSNFLYIYIYHSQSSYSIQLMTTLVLAMILMSHKTGAATDFTLLVERSKTSHFPFTATTKGPIMWKPGFLTSILMNSVANLTSWQCVNFFPVNSLWRNQLQQYTWLVFKKTSLSVVAMALACVHVTSSWMVLLWARFWRHGLLQPEAVMKQPCTLSSSLVPSSLQTIHGVESHRLLCGVLCTKRESA